MARTTQRSAKQRSRQIREAAIGTHIVNTSKRAARTNMNFRSGRSRARAHRGEINQMIPDTRTRESASMFAQRSRRTGLVVKEERRSRLRGLAILGVIILLALVVALFVSRCTYGSQVSGKMSYDDEPARALLVAPEENAPYYTLIIGEYDDGIQPDEGPDMLILARVDEQGQKLTLLSIPPATQVVLPDNRNHRIADAQTYGGDAELITQVHNLTGVDIAHVVKIDEDGFVKLVDALGGITVDVPEEVDDPEAGSTFIPAGVQTLNGEDALVLCRADNYANPFTSRSAAQMNVLISLLNAMASHTALDFMAQLDAIAPCIKTDMTSDQVSNMFSLFSNGATVYTATLPGTVYTTSSGVFYSVPDAARTAVMDAVKDGKDPSAEAKAAAKANPRDVTVTVRNGAGVAGAASRVSELLTEAGYEVVDVGNADSYVYDETLVVYDEESFEAVAEDVVSKVGSGRVTDASIYYNFDSDILVVIGSDWKPVD